MAANNHEIGAEFEWARSLTIDLIDASSEQDLQFQLSAVSSPLWKQFRHIRRVHENYLQALETGQVRFGFSGCDYRGGCSKAGLRRYFEAVARRHKDVLAATPDDIEIDWFGQKATLALHLTRLLSHETLHHGQLILYWKALNHPFPPSWRSWGE